MPDTFPVASIVRELKRGENTTTATVLQPLTVRDYPG